MIEPRPNERIHTRQLAGQNPNSSESAFQSSAGQTLEFSGRPNRWKGVNHCVPGAEHPFDSEAGGTDRAQINFQRKGIFAAGQGVYRMSSKKLGELVLIVHDMLTTYKQNAPRLQHARALLKKPR